MRKQFMSPKKKWTIEDLRLQEETIKSVYQWWTKEIQAKSSKLQKLLESSESNYMEVEELQEEIQKLQIRGAMEEKILNNFEKEKENYLKSALISGAMTMKWES
jgi:hypothetical protein